MSDIIDIIKLIELKRTLAEKFQAELHIHDTCGGQYFSLENVVDHSSIDYINNYFSRYGYKVIFNNDYTEFHIEEMRIC